MAIARDNNARVATWGTGSTASTSFTCTGTDRFLVVAIFSNSATTSASVTYGGVSMTLLGGAAVIDPDGNKNWFFYLENPASGSNTLAISCPGAAAMSAVAASYTGADQSTPIDASVTDSGNNPAASSFTTSSLTNGSADNWLIGAFRDLDGTTNTSSELSLVEDHTPVSEEIWDSNGTVAAGSQSVTYNMSPNGRIYGHTLISLKAATAGTNVSVTAGTQSVVTNGISPSVSIDSSATVGVTGVSMSADIPLYAVETSTSVSFNTAEMTLSAISPTLIVDGVTNITQNIATQNTEISPVSVTVITEVEGGTDVVVAMSQVTLLLEISPRITEGLLWNRIARTV